MTMKCGSQITTLLLFVFSINVFACQGIARLLPLPVATEVVWEDVYSGGIRSRFESAPHQQDEDYDPSLYAAGSTSRIYLVEPGSALQGELGLWNHFPDLKPVKLLLLLNYQQVEFHLDEREFATSFDIDLLPDEIYTFTLTTLPLAEGYYDFALVIVVNPENAAKDTRSRARTTFTPVIRRSVFVGGAMPPGVDFKPFQNVAEDAEHRYTDALFLTDKTRGFNQWPGSGRKVAPGKVFNLFLRFATPNYTARPGVDAKVDGVPFAFVAFMDDQVVPFGEDPVVYGRGFRGEIVTIPIKIVAPGTSGVHQFFIHRFPNPYNAVKVEGPVDRSFYSLSTQRVVIEVEEP